VGYRWQYQDGNGHEMTGPEVSFEDQVDAEDWFGANWRDLLDAGVRQVILLHHETEVYGPMSLLPAQP